jgi:N-acetylglucosaminyldiphosphoundecaprenol N-acetyl-beta-D-mannosaminyltransferase
LISLTGAHGLVHAQRDAAFASALRAFELNLPDGRPGVWIGRYFKRAGAMEQIRGADFFASVMRATAGTSITHYLCGGKPGVADRLAYACRNQLGNDRIAGTWCPPFRSLTDAEWDELAHDITAAGPDIVWIGLGTPKQELFAQELARRVRVHYLATIGAAFDIHVGDTRDAPRFVQRSGLEWAYRMLRDPKRLVRRYATVVPLFLLYNLREIMGRKQ